MPNVYCHPAKGKNVFVFFNEMKGATSDISNLQEIQSQIILTFCSPKPDLTYHHHIYHLLTKADGLESSYFHFVVCFETFAKL